MGIDRNKRDPKRRRTTVQRLKGRLKPVWILPEAENAANTTQKSKRGSKKKVESAEETKSE